MGSELLLLITLPVVAKSDRSAELDTVNFILSMFFIYIFRKNFLHFFGYRPILFQIVDPSPKT